MKYAKVLISTLLIFLICGLALVALKPVLKKNPAIVSLAHKLRDGFQDNIKVIGIEFTTPEENLETTKLPVYSLWIKPKKLDILNSNLPQSGRNYVSGEFEYAGKYYQAKFRYRGDMPWHWISTQKSMRVRFSRQNLFGNSLDINLNNPEREAIDEVLEFWLGKKMGLLTPECSIVHVRLNGKYLGVFLDIENIDEYFLINHNQEKGDIYYGEQGDMPYEDYVNVWGSDKVWIKKTFANPKSPNDRSDLDNFIRVLKIEDQKLFREQIVKVIDLDKVLTYVAFADICSTEHIGNINNNRLYFKPSTGKLELIPWDTAGHWTDEGAELIFERKKNDFWMKLLEIPQYRQLKNNILWDNLNGVASTASQIDFIDQKYKFIREDIYADKYKDTYFLRPMSNAEFDQRVLRLKDWVTKRNTLLMDILKASKLYVFDKLYKEEGRQIIKKLELVSANESGVRIKSISIPLDYKLPQDSWFELWYDKNSNGMLDAQDELISKSQNSIEFSVNRTMVNGIEIIEPSGYTRVQYKWMDQVPRLLPAKYSFFIVLSNGAKNFNYSKLSGQIFLSENIICQNSVTGGPTEIIICPSGNDCVKGINLDKLSNKKGELLD